MDLYIYKFLRQILPLVCKKCSQNGGKKKIYKKLEATVVCMRIFCTFAAKLLKIRL